MKKSLVSRALEAHGIIMEDIMYQDLFFMADGASAEILEAANLVADPIGDQLTEDKFRSIINGLISHLLTVSDFRYNEGIEKLRELL